MKLLLAMIVTIVATSIARAQPASTEAAAGSDASGSDATGSGSGSDAVDATTAPAPPSPTDDAKEKKKKKKHKGDKDWDESMQGDIVDDEDEPELASRGMRFRWLFQTRYTETYPTVTDSMHFDPAVGDGYQIFRVFMRATAKPRPWLKSKLLIDFAELARKTGARSLKLAYADIKLHSRVVATVGLFKRTFSLLELMPIAEYELADVGPVDTLIKDAELGGRDIGAMIRVDPLHKRRWLSLHIAAMSGAVFGDDARVDGMLTGRITSEPVKHLSLGIDGAWRRKGQQVPTGFIASVGPGKAISADVTYQNKWITVRGEWLWGDRADFNHRGDDVNGNGGARTFMGAWAVAAARVRVADLVVMPATRGEWLDADREHPIGRRYYVSAAINVMDGDDQVRFLLDVSRQIVQPGTIPLGQAPGLLDQSATILNVQMQIKI